MQLFTSYWGNPELPHIDAVMVGISRGQPRWKLPYRYRVLDLLAPNRATFALEDLGQFEEAYLAGLEDIGQEVIIGALEQMAREGRGKPLVLLCWEAPGEPCHRFMAASWLREKAGIEVPELVPGKLPRRGVPDQGTLF
jgi:hypothetical protein